MVLFYMQKKITVLILIAGLGLFGLYTLLQSDDTVDVEKSDVPDFAAISDAMSQAGGMQLAAHMPDVIDLLEIYQTTPDEVAEHGRNALIYADSQRGALDHLYTEVTARLL